MNQENQRVMLTKRLLKDALLRLLEKKPIEKISITELCAESGINRATFYRHYALPHDLLDEIVMDMNAETLHLAPLPTDIKEAKPYLVRIFTYLYDRADLIRVLIRCNSDTDLVRVIDRFYRSVLEFIHTNGGEPLDEDSLRLLSTYLAGGGYYMLRQWLLEDIRKTPEEMAELMFSLLERIF